MLTFASRWRSWSVVGASVKWAVRKERRRNLKGEGHARDH